MFIQIFQLKIQIYAKDVIYYKCSHFYKVIMKINENKTNLFVTIFTTIFAVAPTPKLLVF